jgi:hypothetical protein
MAGNILIFISRTNDHRYRVLLRLLLFPFFEKSYTAVKEGIKENLYKSGQAKEIKNDFPHMIRKNNPIHKQKWFGGKFNCENNLQSVIAR